MSRKSTFFLSFVLLFLLVYPAAAQSPYSLRKFEVVGYGANTVLSPDGHTLAVYDDAAFNNNEVDPAVLPIRLVNLDDGQEKFTLTSGITDYTVSAAFSSDGKLLASAQENGTLTIWDTASGALVNTFTDTLGPHILAFVPGSHLLLDGAGINTQLWDVDSGVIQRLFTLHFDTYADYQAQLQSGPPLFLAGLVPLPDGKSFATLTSSGFLTQRNIADAQETVLLPGFTEMVDTLRRVNPTFTPDGKYLLYGDFKDKQIHIVDMSTQQDQRQIDVSPVPTSHFFAVAPDNDTLAVLQPAPDSRDSGVVHLYSLATGSSLFDIPVPTKRVGRYQVAFTPDGKQVVISGFWDTSREGHNVVYVAGVA